jgi:hypothetical protein
MITRASSEFEQYERAGFRSLLQSRQSTGDHLIRATQTLFPDATLSTFHRSRTNNFIISLQPHEPIHLLLGTIRSWPCMT